VVPAPDQEICDEPPRYPANTVVTGTGEYCSVISYSLPPPVPLQDAATAGGPDIEMSAFAFSEVIHV